MSLEIRYAGPLPADTGQGLHGGACALAVVGGAMHEGVFVLRVEKRQAYGIADLDVVRGACAAEPDGYRLEARVWHSRTDETTPVASDRPLTSRWHARFLASAPTSREDALELDFGLAAAFHSTLLLRQPDRGAPVPPALARWFEDECARRQTAADAAREQRWRAQDRARRTAASTTAFAVKDYAGVVALLGPIELTLSPAERQRLALARRHLPEAP